MNNKVVVDENFLNELINKSWLDSEHIQNQLENIDSSTALGMSVIKALKNLLISQHVFTGCLENLAEEISFLNITQSITDTTTIDTDSQKIVHIKDKTNIEPQYDETENLNSIKYSNTASESEPFEYFVDFEEPIGKPLTDEELYGNY